MARGDERSQESLTWQLLAFGVFTAVLLWQGITCSKCVTRGKKGREGKGGQELQDSGEAGSSQPP